MVVSGAARYIFACSQITMLDADQEITEASQGRYTLVSTGIYARLGESMNAQLH